MKSTKTQPQTPYARFIGELAEYSSRNTCDVSYHTMRVDHGNGDIHIVSVPNDDLHDDMGNFIRIIHKYVSKNDVSRDIKAYNCPVRVSLRIKDYFKSFTPEFCFNQLMKSEVISYACENEIVRNMVMRGIEKQMPKVITKGGYAVQTPIMEYVMASVDKKINNILQTVYPGLHYARVGSSICVAGNGDLDGHVIENLIEYVFSMTNPEFKIDRELTNTRLRTPDEMRNLKEVEKVINKLIYV